ncbi:hypothetical protein CEE37_10130 [candidate division LCP-89 bacterium B3_LCP]|uniref:UmuC domain-containing protein n=1 Tax=candidate division LCP-89 bacterium B3_LCP TaxID=2012998 RepID=A0A532UYT0_UNCL8|nr:MAG: hypothetical protein CEE37_10130 [candidate division LCP-89 bacterium B3_LCP]
MPLNRSIVFMRIPAFGIAVERACRSGLVERPLVVAPPDSARALVQLVSDEARAAGIRRGMRLNEARRICRDVITLYPNPPLYARAEAAILRILEQYSPCIEPDNIHSTGILCRIPDVGMGAGGLYAGGEGSDFGA